MTTRILSIGTAVPEARLRQDQVRDLFAGQPGADRLTRRLIGAAFDASAIETRHTVLDDLAAAAAASAPAGDERMPTVTDAGSLLAPSTGARNDAYIRLAPPLFAEAARKALAAASVTAAEVTHVVTVSCTGMFAPGPDYRLVRDLELPTTVARAHLGFMGCAAAVPALRTAAQTCAADPTAVVLVVCAELCSLHVRTPADHDEIVAASVFADGAAAAVVSADPSRATGASFELDRFATVLTDEGEKDMAWTIGDTGFEMVLSAEVPRIIGREIRGAVETFLGDDGVDTWAVHPGGRSVLDRVEAGLELPADALTVSRDVLRDYGNMSSATILFILGALLAAGLDDGDRVATLAFGPGLTLEAARLTFRTGAA
ncbi:type III polyketide synthase [Microbacterium sp. KSW4-11]|uniref:Type III polyketide synthase n=1 Tax=Microbacterium gawkjiense TaxID=3067309 RepID=A0ABU3G9D5_9MICO|nr:type III polyketide synthase [Microbacterium sp. KSW4-11]MDT3316432.1 type III polyketide synthase [Microbacterium sp. KSW4-11]